MNQVVGNTYEGLTASVPVQAIDQLPSLRHAACWKLDVEGHEAAVLAGAARTLAEAPPAVILCEDRSLPVQRLLIEAGYQACSYNPFRRRLNPDPSAIGGNQLWVRAMDWVQERVQAAPPFTVLGERI